MQQILFFITCLSGVSSFTLQTYNNLHRNAVRNHNPNTWRLQQQQRLQQLLPLLEQQSSSKRRRSDSALLSSEVQGDAANTTDSKGTDVKLSTESQTKTDDDDEEWEYEEYENLTEQDFYDSEWKVGTLMENSNEIDETWARLVVKDGEFVCVWGDASNGKWNFDAASQFLSMTKETFGGWGGKKIWAGTVDDFYYIQGTVRGWSPISPASVVGQWQCRRLGVDKDEAGIAPWFQEDEEETGDDESSTEVKEE